MPRILLSGGPNDGDLKTVSDPAPAAVIIPGWTYPVGGAWYVRPEPPTPPTAGANPIVYTYLP